MENTPRFNGAFGGNEIVRPYSDNRELSESEWNLIFLASHSKPRNGEPEVLRKARRRIASAKKAGDHLLNEGLSPILESFSFEALQKEKK